MSRLNIKTLFENLRFKYKLSILNENTLEEVWFIRLSRLRVYLLSFLLLVVLFFVNTFLLLKTPLKKYTPGYTNSDLRTELIQQSIKSDSLIKEFEVRQEYINAIKSLMIGDIKIDKILPIDSLALKEREKNFIEKSKKEKEFCENFENEEKYNLSVLESSKSQNILVFCPPTRGLLIQKFMLNKRHYGVDISTSPNESVVAVIDGNVIFSGYTIDEGYVIALQHDENFVSFYKHNSVLLKKAGDFVKSGESIAIVGNTGEGTTVNHLHFELWKDGKPQNPQDYIIF